MYHFFVNQEQIGQDTVTVTGPDVNHIKNVLRMKPGEEVLISNGVDKDYVCRLQTITSDAVTAEIVTVTEGGTELPATDSIYFRDFRRVTRWSSSSRRRWSWAFTR